MPKTYNLSTDEQIAHIRRGLLTPRLLWGAVLDRFAAGGVSRSANRVHSPGGDKGMKEWEIGGLTVRARTRSEARARYKQETGRAVPKGEKPQRKAA